MSGCRITAIAAAMPPRHARTVRPIVVSLAAACALALPAALQATEPGRCLDLRKPHAAATVTGILTVRTFAGPPNYESIAKGDAEEKALILELPTPACADDGEFIDSSKNFDTVHVSSSIPAILNTLNAAVGRRVTIHGEAFGAHTGHHHAPLVLFADEVAVR